MKIYCKPFEDLTNNPLNGKVVDISSNTTNLPIAQIDDVYEQYPYTVERMIALKDDEGNVVLDDFENELMIVAVDEEGNVIYDTLIGTRLKECVVEFDVTEETFLSRNLVEMYNSTYWVDKIGIALVQDEYIKCSCDYIEQGICCDKVREIEAKIKIEELENDLLKEKEARATHSVSILDVAKIALDSKQRIELLENGGAL